jgi:23S rRNA pseudouridine955/2504/2580 synthase
VTDLNEHKPQVRFETITEKNVLQRIDNYLLGRLKGVPKSKIYKVIRKGEVRINKKRCKPETKLQLGDIIRIPPVFGVKEGNFANKISESLSALLDSAVLFEDDRLLVINKPSGLAVHGGSGINVGLIEALRVKYADHQFLELVHRLDRDTSGAIIVAKSRLALRALHAQFRDNQVNKIYHLAVHGKWPRHKTFVDAPLRKNELKSGERVVRVSQDGKPSKTFFRILSKQENFSLVEAKPISGRTHQIRVHAAFSQCPIVGDDKYIQDIVDNRHGMEKARLMLHARLIEFDLPVQSRVKAERVRIEAPYDEVYSKTLQKMNLQIDEV